MFLLIFFILQFFYSLCHFFVVERKTFILKWEYVFAMSHASLQPGDRVPVERLDGVTTGNQFPNSPRVLLFDVSSQRLG